MSKTRFTVGIAAAGVILVISIWFFRRGPVETRLAHERTDVSSARPRSPDLGYPSPPAKPTLQTASQAYPPAERSVPPLDREPDFAFKAGIPIRDQLIKVFTRILGYPPKFRAAVRERLGEVGPIMLDILRDKSQSDWVRAGAASTAGRHRVPGVSEALIEASREEGMPCLREAVIRHLGTLAEPGNARALAKMVPSEDDVNTRRKIVEALGYTGEAESLSTIDALIFSTASPNLESLVDSANRARRQIAAANAPDPVVASIPLLHDERHEMRKWAIWFLKRKNPPDLSVRLREAADSLKNWSLGLRRAHYDLEYELLKSLRDAGGALSPREAAFVDAIQSNHASPPPD